LNNRHTHSKAFASTQQTVIIKEALANGRIFKMKSSAIIKSFISFRSLAKKYQVGTDAVALICHG
jgi:hypothetical protein